MLKQFTLSRFWLGLFFILLIYSLYWLLLADNNQALVLPRMWRHVIKILVVFAVYGTGTFFLGRLPQKWLLQLWHLIHGTLIIILIGLWTWHFLISPLPLNLRKLGFSIHEFLISPLLYLATGLMGRVTLEK